MRRDLTREKAMDPNACLRKILNLLGEIYDNESDEGATLDRERREEAVQALGALAEWLDKGGFAPRAGHEPSMLVTLDGGTETVDLNRITGYFEIDPRKVMGFLQHGESDCDDPDCPGWIPGNGQVERCDICKRFLSDDDANYEAESFDSDRDQNAAYEAARKERRKSCRS